VIDTHLTNQELSARLRVLEKQMAVVVQAIELLIHGLHDNAAAEIAKIK